MRGGHPVADPHPRENHENVGVCGRGAPRPHLALESLSGAAPTKCTELASAGGASATTISYASSSSQVCRAAALRARRSRPAYDSRMTWQAARRDKIAGRVVVGIALLLQGAQAPDSNPSTPTCQPNGHGRAAGCLDWPFPAVPALSPTILCSTMLAGAPAASSTIGSVVEDVETAVGASSGAALALEVTMASDVRDGCKKCGACGRVCVCQYTLCMGLMHGMDSNNSPHDVSKWN